MKIYSKENEYENKDFFESVNLISEDILKRYNDRIDKIGLIGFSKVSLPLLVEISKRTNIKIINIFDYKDVKYINSYVESNIDEFIIFEDIISLKKEVSILTNELKNRGKKVLAIYSLFMNKEMKCNNKYNLFNSNISKILSTFLLEKGLL